MRTFRFDTFGSEDFWGGKLKLHQAIQGKRHGGAGATLDDVIEHYDKHLNLRLSDKEKSDLIDYLKSI